MKKLLFLILSFYCISVLAIQAKLEHQNAIIATAVTGGAALTFTIYSSYAEYQNGCSKNTELKKNGFLNYFFQTYKRAHTRKGIKEFSLPTARILFSEFCLAGSGLYVAKQLIKKDAGKIIDQPCIPLQPKPKTQAELDEEEALRRSLVSKQEDEDLRKALEESKRLEDEKKKNAELQISPFVEEVFTKTIALPHSFDGKFFAAGAELPGNIYIDKRGEKNTFGAVDVYVKQRPSLDQREDYRSTLGVVTPGDLCGYYVVANALALHEAQFIGTPVEMNMSRDQFNKFLKPAMQKIETLRKNAGRPVAGLTMLADEEIEALLKEFVPEVELSYLPVPMLVEQFAATDASVKSKVYVVHTDVVGRNGHWIAVRMIKNSPTHFYAFVADSMNINRVDGAGALDKLT